MRRHGESPKSPTSPTTMEQLLQGEGSRWAGNSPTYMKEFSDLEEDHTHHNKKSVLAKVMERAKKWKHTLVKKKQGNDDNATPPWGVSLDEEEEDAEECPEYFGAPMYESELAPDEYKGTARQNPRAVPVISEKHVLPNSTSQSANEQEREKPQGFNNKTVTENTTIVTLKVEELTVSSPRKGEQKWDKGVSAKELLIKKLEPGEDERALSQVISQAISPRRSPSDMGMVGKVKEAVTSWIWNESTSTTLTNASTTSSSSSSAHIPISTDVHEGTADHVIT